MENLNGRVDLVTGGARDIARAISLSLAKAGAKVVVNYFDNEEPGKETVEDIEKDGGTPIAVYADVTKKDDIDTMVKTTLDHFGSQVDILVNVAGGLFALKPLKKWTKLFTTSLWTSTLNLFFELPKPLNLI